MSAGIIIPGEFLRSTDRRFPRAARLLDVDIEIDAGVPGTLPENRKPIYYKDCPLMVAPNDRRVSPRWVAVKNQSTLELQGADGHRRVKATLVNISRDGALIVADERLPSRGALWFRMETPAKTDWIAVEPVRHDGTQQMGVRFVRPCPDDFLLTAMLGVDLVLTILEDGRPLSLDDAGCPV